MVSSIYVIDIVLLVILYILIMFMCGYSFFCVYRLLRSMQMRILLRPTRVVFSHKNEGESTEELRTVVAYQNPFTGDYCVHKSRLSQGYINPSGRATPTSPGYRDPRRDDSADSGLSDAYEPLRDVVPIPGNGVPELCQNPLGDYCVHKSRLSRGYINPSGRDTPTSPGYRDPRWDDSADSGLSDVYEREPLRDVVPIPGNGVPEVQVVSPPKKPTQSDNSVNKTWNWNYKEYQI